jgi:hypothetical protein
MFFRFRFLPIFLVLLALVGPSLAAESPEQTIQYLIDYVAKSDATFIRNGVKHTPAEAVEHIKAKYAHFKNEIKTPEDFIRLSASKSLLTGEPYMVRTPDGKEMHLDVWLTDALREYRAKKHE